VTRSGWKRCAAGHRLHSGESEGGGCERCAAAEISLYEYVRELRRCVRSFPIEQRRIVAEVRAHLEDATSRERAAGWSQTEAERRAIAALGSPSWMASRFPRPSHLPGLLLGAMALIGGLVLLGLGVVGTDPQIARATVEKTVWAGGSTWAQRCVEHWNSPINASARGNIRDLLIDAPPAGLARSDEPEQEAPPSVGIDPHVTLLAAPAFGAWRHASCVVVVTVDSGSSHHRERLDPYPRRPRRSYAWPDGSRHTRPLFEGTDHHHRTVLPRLAPPTHLGHGALKNSLATGDTFLPDGKLKSSPLPPQVLGQWNNKFQFAVTLTSPQSLPIAPHQRACIRLVMQVNRPAEITDPSHHDGPKQLSPNTGHTTKTCIRWHPTLASTATGETVTVRRRATDNLTGKTVTATLVFRIEGRRTAWILRYIRSH
jgi:hypothetical protein